MAAVSYSYHPAFNKTLVALAADASAPSMPVDMVLLIDTSGSMGRPSNERAEGLAGRYSRLDLVKHCVRIAEGALRENDRLGVVEFNCDVRVVARLDADAQDGAGMDATLDTIDACGGTNLWDGLAAALDHAKNAGRPEALKTIFLLTDGEPQPARREGEDNLTKQWFQQNPEANVTLHTFGFGYDLNSQLLVRIARNGHGSYNFIPDHSMLATVINSALANVGTTVLDHADVPLPSDAGVLGGPHDVQAARVRVHSLRAGQTRHLLLNGEHAIEGARRVDADGELFAHQMARVAFVDGVKTAHQLARLDLDDARKVLRDQVVPKLVSPDSPLAQDVYGQVSEAIATREAFERWGVHYLPSLVGAHCDERVNNFKDAGVKAYTTPAYEEALGRLEQAFDALVVPPPTLSVGAYGGPVTGIPVAVGLSSFRDAFYNASGGCITAETLVSMADGTQRRADSLRKGDVVRTPEGAAAIACVCVSECEDDKVEVVELAPDVALTPWHPVRRLAEGGAWEFPAKLGAAVTRANTPEVYNLLLEPGHTGVVCGSEGSYCAIALAHGISDDAVAAHDFYGTRKVVDAYARLPGFDDGRVVLGVGTARVARDGGDGRVTGVLVGEGAAAAGA